MFITLPHFLLNGSDPLAIYHQSMDGCPHTVHTHSISIPSVLGLGFVTAEKIQPSPLAIVGDISQAINIEKRMTRTRTALKDVLNRVVADFNRLTTNRKHRIDSARKGLIYNLLRCPDQFLQLLHKHYDGYKHSESALPHEILQSDFYVPGVTTRMEQPQYNGNGKDVFQEILQTTEESCLLWALRNVQE